MKLKVRPKTLFAKEKIVLTVNGVRRDFKLSHWRGEGAMLPKVVMKSCDNGNVVYRRRGSGGIPQLMKTWPNGPPKYAPAYC